MSVRGFRPFVAGFAFGSLCLMSSLAVPTSAIALSDQSRSSLPVVIDESIPDDAELISTELAVLDDGSLVYVKDGSVAPTSLMGSRRLLLTRSTLRVVAVLSVSVLGRLVI